VEQGVVIHPKDKERLAQRNERQVLLLMAFQCPLTREGFATQ